MQMIYCNYAARPTSAISCRGSRKGSSWLPLLLRPFLDNCSIVLARSCTVPCLKGVFSAVLGTCTRSARKPCQNRSLSSFEDALPQDFNVATAWSLDTRIMFNGLYTASNTVLGTYTRVTVSQQAVSKQQQVNWL